MPRYDQGICRYVRFAVVCVDHIGENEAKRVFVQREFLAIDDCMNASGKNIDDFGTVVKMRGESLACFGTKAKDREFDFHTERPKCSLLPICVPLKNNFVKNRNFWLVF